MDWLFSQFIKSDFVRAQVLAVVRHLLTALGVALVSHGLADHGMAEDLVGLGVAAASFYLSNLDVKNVDKKITIALNTPSPIQTQEQEVQETKELNLQEANKNVAPGKAGW